MTKRNGPYLSPLLTWPRYCSFLLFIVTFPCLPNFLNVWYSLSTLGTFNILRRESEIWFCYLPRIFQNLSILFRWCLEYWFSFCSFLNWCCWFLQDNICFLHSKYLRLGFVIHNLLTVLRVFHLMTISEASWFPNDYPTLPNLGFRSSWLVMFSIAPGDIMIILTRYISIESIIRWFPLGFHIFMPLTSFHFILLWGGLLNPRTKECPSTHWVIYPKLLAIVCWIPYTGNHSIGKASSVI